MYIMYPNANVLSRVFNLRVTDDSGPTTGTMFALDVNGREYLVTARHLAEHIVNGKAEVWRKNNGTPIQ